MEQIEAFIAAARAPSFRMAAETCALSPAAFSRRVQAFSAFVGLALFEKTAAGLRLTDAGHRCLEELEPAYAELRRAAAHVSRPEGARIGVTLSLSHSLAVGWLIPRLERFRAAHPRIELSLRTRRDAADVRSGDADLGLCFSDVDLSGLSARPLLEAEATPVAAPATARAFAGGAKTLRDQRLLTVARPPDVWGWWAKCAGLEDDLTPAASFDLLDAMYECAAEGSGVALGSSPTLWPHLESGRLVCLGLPVVRFPGDGYRLAERVARKPRWAVSAVSRWLQSEALRSPRLSETAAR
jgi:DNA-binding transcriptional LysR family regulator